MFGAPPVEAAVAGGNDRAAFSMAEM